MTNTTFSPMCIESNTATTRQRHGNDTATTRHRKPTSSHAQRYITLLFLLLTLGVGQMWANNTSVTFYYAVDATTAGSSCNDVKYCIKYGGGDGEWTAWTSMAKQDKTQGGKLVYKATYTFPWDGYYNWQFIVGSTTYEWYAGSWNSTLHNGQIYVQGSGWTTYSPDASYTVYFVNTNDWTAANVKAYAWNDNGGSACDYNASWAGSVMTSTGKSLGGHTIYKLDFNKRYSNIIFSDNGSSQTSDLTLGTTNAGKMYDNGTWKTYQFDITLDQQSGSGGTSSVTGVVGSAMPGSQTAPTRTGYTFGGYYTSTGGGGTCYYNASMVSQQTVSTSTPNTLYAKWTAQTYTITYKDQGGGDFSGTQTSAPTSHTYGTATTLKIPTKTGYMFGGWYTSEDCSTGAVGTASSASLSATGYTADITLYAKWTAITVSATVSPTSGTVGSNSLTFSITSNVPTNSNYYVGVYNFGANEYSAGELNGVVAYNANPQSYTGSPNFASTGTYYTRVFVMKESEVLATSDKVSFLVAAATYSVTVQSANATMGSISPTSINAAADSWSSTITATPNAGYKFDNWTSSGGGITINGNTANPTQIKATSTGGTLTANFSAATYRVTLNNQSATTAGTEYVDATYKSTTFSTITKPTKTNYTFGGYYTETGGGGTQIIDANGNWLASKTGYTDGSKKSLVTENKTLFAYWTETKYAVTIAVDDASHASGDIACTAAGWDAGKSGTAQIGNVTNVTITVGAAASGYKFDGGYWTLTGGVTLVSGSLTNPSITVKATATGSATYTYAEDLSTPYVIKGGEAITGSDWSVDIPFTKKTGESTGTVAYAEIPISSTVVTDVANTDFNMKVYNNSNSHWVGLNEGSGDWWYYSNSGEKTLTDDAGYNIQLRANVVGTYIVKLDYTTAGSPKITITWPVALSIYRSNPTDGTNIGDHAWASMPSNTSYRWNFDLEANTTYEFKINDKGTYYGHNTLINTSISNRVFATGTSDTKLETKSAGRFIITYNSSDHNVTVVYPKSVVAGASPTKVYTGGTTTLTGYASELGSGSHTITYEFFKGTTLTDANKIYTTSNTATATYQQASYDATVDFAGNTTSQIYTVRIKEGGSVLGTNTVTVYRKWDIYVHDVDSWNSMYYYVYDNAGGGDRDTWPGLNYSDNKYNGTTTWYTVTLDGEYPHFILNTNNGKKQTWGNGVYANTLVVFPAGSFWYVEYKETTGENRYYDLHSINPTNPTVTLSASVANCKDITLTGTVTNNGGDGSFASDMKEVYFTVGGTKNAATTVSTTDGTFTKTLTNATAGATNTLQAFAENVVGTGSSSAINYSNVTLDRQEGTTGTTAVTAVNGFAMPAGATKPGRTGYTFGGYYASTGGSGKQYYNASMGSANNWDQTSKDKTIFAKWTPLEYTITYELNGGTSEGVVPWNPATYTIEQNVPAFTANPRRDGYTFAGWYTDSGLNTPISTPYVISVGTYGDKTYYAKWTPNNYTVTFDATTNGGTCATASKSVTFASAYGNLPIATHSGADSFIGWYTTASGEGTLVTAETTVSTASDHILYARFEHTYTVTVQYKCGSDVLYPQTSVSASETSVAAAISAPDILGYAFSSWTGSNVTFDDDRSASTTIHATSATTITANYTIVPMVYFKNNLEWDNVFVTFDCGFSGEVPTLTGKPYYKMSQLGTSDIFYCVIPDTYTASNYASWAWNIAFDNVGTGYNAETHRGTYAFNSGEFLGRGDFDPNATMFIPYNGDTKSLNGGTCYKTGCWIQYNTNYSGYKVHANTYVQGSGGTSTEVMLTSSVAGSTEFSAKVSLSTANYVYGIMLYKDYAKNTNDIWYTNVNNEENTITSATTSLPWSFEKCTDSWQRCRVKTEALGEYIFTVSFATGRPMVNIEYPVTVGDFRLVYKDRATWNKEHDAAWYQASPVFKKQGDRVDIASFFVSYGNSPSVELQKCTAIDGSTGAQTWTKQGNNIDISSITEKGVYNFQITQNGDGTSATVIYLEAYSGKYYVRTDASDGGWNDYKSTANSMTYTEYSMDHGGSSGPYSYYFMRHVNAGQNIKFVVANDYNMCLTDTMINDTYASEWIEREANVRFTYNHENNEIHRAYISGASIVADRFLVLEGDEHLYDENGNPLTTAGGGKIDGLNDHEMKFFDDQNWVYEATVQANPLERVKLTAKFNNQIQYFYGAEGDRSEATTHQLIGGTASATKYKMRVVYDFKTNRLLAAWLPESAVTTELPIEADIMIIRKHQEDAKQITFSGAGKLTDVRTVYGAMHFNKYLLNNQSEESGHASLGWSTTQRDLFFISFPFEVKLNDVFGFGTYGKHWIIEYYDGKGRAEKGFWADSPSNWKFVTKAMKDEFVLEANQGYVLALDLDELKPESSVWNYGVENVYLYFPSTALVENIEATTQTVTIDQTGYQCTINRNTPDGDRRIKDSYWHLIGVPSYANASHNIGNSWTSGTPNVPNVDVDTWSTLDVPYVYQWTPSTNELTPIKSSTTFKPLYCYMAQYAKGTIYWSSVNATPQAVAARRNGNYKGIYEFCLELQQNGEEADHTFVSLRDNEEVTTAFDFNYDLCKELYGGFIPASNIYTMIGEDIEAAANCLPLELEQVTTIPVGVVAKTNGEYTFAMPDGTEGLSVTLLDSETGVHTDLSVEDYTVELTAGTYENRFYLSIDPRNAATLIDEAGNPNDDVRTAKILKNGLLYIQRGERIYDATGREIE